MYYFDNSAAYAAEVEKWTEKFNKLMMEYNNAPEAILAYYLPGQNTCLSCPLGDEEFQQIGEDMRTNEAMLRAAEESGLLVEAVKICFYKALDNYGSWSYLCDDLAYILDNPRLRCYVCFEDQFFARKLLAVNTLNEDDEDLWDQYYDTLQKKLVARELRGYAYN